MKINSNPDIFVDKESSIEYYKLDGYVLVNGLLRYENIIIPKSLDQIKITKLLQKHKNDEKLFDYLSDLWYKSDPSTIYFFEGMSNLTPENDNWGITFLKLLLNIIMFIDKSMIKPNENIIVYRAMDLSMRKIFDDLLKDKETIVFKNYSSTTYSFDIAKDYGDVIICFKLPKNILHFDFTKTKNFSIKEEKEILLQRNLIIEIVDKINEVFIVNIKNQNMEEIKNSDIEEIKKIIKKNTKPKLPKPTKPKPTKPKPTKPKPKPKPKPLVKRKKSISISKKRLRIIKK